MTAGANFLAHWYYHVPDLIIAALVYMLIGRLGLALIWGANSNKIIARVLNRMTDPVLAGVGAITPRVVPAGLVIVFAIAWLLAARLALFIAVTAKGVRLAVG
jgi:uncharacterized protein YggT (Ycf19 family)